MAVILPEGLLWGAATAAYQNEGAWGEDGKGAVDPGHHQPDARTGAHGDTGDEACDAKRFGIVHVDFDNLSSGS